MKETIWAISSPVIPRKRLPTRITSIRPESPPACTSGGGSMKNGCR